MKKWRILDQRSAKSEKRKAEEILKILLENRGIKTKKEAEEFLNPKLENITADSVGINKKQLGKAIARIKLAINNKEQIIIYGDYDVDGICGTAILWETLSCLGAKVLPYIPHRIEEGYGLSVKGIENCKLKIANCSLIITVDNGVVANQAVDFANKKGIDVIITDHHVLPKKLPDAFAVIHTTKLCGTGVAWLLSQEILNSKSQIPDKSKILNTKYLIQNTFLELVALATVADLVPLKGANRTLLKFGLEALRKTKRVGLLELLKEAGLQKETLGIYEIGHMIAPRLNATGRLDYAMDSLRLICTTDPKRAEKLAGTIGLTNKERQFLTIQTTEHAIEMVKNKKDLQNLLIIVHESYQQGVIGLVAGKLVEEFYRPAIVVSKGKKYSKASARSVAGFNMIEFIRSAQEFLVDAGGHPMAAGFTIETAKLPLLRKALEDKSKSLLNKDLLTRSLRIDLKLPLSAIDINLYNALQRLSPFGMGNPEPTFLSKVVIEDMRLVGMEGKHLKFRLSESRIKNQESSGSVFDGIGFGLGDRASEFRIGDKVSIVYTLEKDEWNGNVRLQLKIKDFKKHVG